MALSITTARNRVKDFADVPSGNSSFDDDINNYVQDAAKQLYPIAMRELGPDTSASFNTDARDCSLPSGYEQVRILELYDSGMSDYYPTSDFKVHNGKIWLDNPVTESTQARIWGWGRHVVAADAANTTVPDELELVVLYWATSFFYDALAGNRRKYNIYVGSGGQAADRDMKDSSAFFMEKANQLLADRAKLAGG